MARGSLEKIKPLLEILELDDSCKDLPKDNGGHVEATCSFIDNLLKLFEDKREGKGVPVDRILGVSEDVLGAYIYSQVSTDFPQSKIELYWGVIG